jgi:hypothetical protein
MFKQKTKQKLEKDQREEVNYSESVMAKAMRKYL